jgi:hypothetical protein
MNKYSCIFYNFKDDLIYKNKNNEDEDIYENKNKNKKNKKYNYKFVSKDFFIENELFISNLISQMINYKKYFYIPSKIEKINFINIDNENVDDFETEYDINLKYRKKITSNNILLKYENITILDFKNYLLFEKKYFFYKIINIYTKLLKSLNMLNEQCIFFNNLNDENIFIDKFDSPILNNFSFSIHLNLIKENLHKFILEYEPSYIQWPIEIHTIAYIFHHKLTSLSKSNIDKIINDIINNNYIFENFNDNIKKKYYDNGISFLSKFINKKSDEIILNIILYFRSWDNYALSILYLQIIIKIYKFIKNKNNKFIIEFMKLLLKNISFNPEQRFSLKDTKLYFNNILNNITKNEYKEIIEALCDTHDYTHTS